MAQRLLGWRGPYAMDALGWHDRARRHLEYWAARQNTDAIPESLPPPDETANLARSEAALHSNGDLSNSHYDMNLVFIDALFRHLLWTGDLAFARRTWPVIERHLAWERRLFRREFGPTRSCRSTRPTPRSGRATTCNTTAAASRTRRRTTTGTTAMAARIADRIGVDPSALRSARRS